MVAQSKLAGRWSAALVVLVSFCWCGPVMAEGPTTTEGEGGEETKSPFSLEVQVDFPTAYFFRGYNIIDGGLLVQPDVTASYEFSAGEELSVSPYIEVWQNFSEFKAPRNPKHWNEVDVTAGVELAWEKWTVGASYLYYTSPSDFFDDIHEVGLTLAYDHWIAPSVGFYREIRDAGGDQDTYLEVSVAPEYEIPDTAVTLTFPVRLGMSLDGYYLDKDGHNELFGYGSVGVDARWDLADHWAIVGGVEYLRLLADSVEAANNDSADAVVGRLGVAFSY